MSGKSNNSGGNNSGGGNSGSNSGGGNNNRRAGNRRRRGPKKPVAKPEEFWGSAEALPTEETHVRITTQPSAVVKSLGRAPLSGHHNIAEHYFTAVYDRSVALAGALAAAGDLLAPPDEDTQLT